MSRIFVFTTGLFLSAALAFAADPAPAFRFGGRYFSPEEAERIAALPPPEALLPNASKKEKISAQREIAGGIVLFARDGIELSPKDALLELSGELLLMPPEVRAELGKHIVAGNLTMEEFVTRESHTLQRQFAAAARKWYRRNFADRDQISDAQIRDWYFRHQARFLEEKIDEEKCFFFMPPAWEAVSTAISMLTQGVSASEVRAAVHAGKLPEDTLAWLKSPDVKREIPAKGFIVYCGADRMLLLQDGALQRSYRKLDKELHDAIEATLYDALARARLAAALEAELKNAEFEFLN